MAVFEYVGLTFAGRIAKGTFICFVVLFLTVAPVNARRFAAGPVKLTLYPATTPGSAAKYLLLPKTDEQTDADAAALYKEALQSLPQDPELQKKISEWRKTPIENLPKEQVESTLQKLQPTIDLFERAARCKRCNWPSTPPDKVTNEMMADLSKYRRIVFILDLQARLHIDKKQYSQAIGTFQTSLAMARHLGQAPTLTQGMVGISVAALTLNRVEELIQCPDAPNLYWALADLPKPAVDVTKTMEMEIENLKKYNFILRNQFKKQLEPAHERIRLQMAALSRQAAALQCVEALRIYAGTHNGAFPDKLSDATDVKIPNDPVTEKPFSYRRTGSTAVLEAPGSKGAEGRDAISYELYVGKR